MAREISSAIMRFYWLSGLWILVVKGAASEPMHKVSAGVARRLLNTKETTKLVANYAAENQQGFHVRALQAEQEEAQKCDSALGVCMGVDMCINCFTELKLNDVDWATVAAGTTCDEVLPLIFEQGHCRPMRTDKITQDLFCNAWRACVKTDNKPKKKTNETATIDCSKLTKCDFDGIHKQFIGDGVCHQKLPGCYNTEVCGYDGGDCCPDTCKTPEDNRYGHECGSAEYFCKDPASESCDKGPLCKGNKEDKGDSEIPDECPEGATRYRLVMYDSFGDGWEETELVLSDSVTKTPIYTGALSMGSQGTAYVCLSTTPKCYTVDANGGIWGKEVSWEVRPMREGAPALGSGGAPMTCEFGVAGGVCKNNCNGRKDKDPTSDPDYKDFKEMYLCVEKKCPIQLKTCQDDASCKTCFDAEDFTPDFCFGVDKFNAVIDCAMCQCTDDTKGDFCDTRTNPGIIPSWNDDGLNDDFYDDQDCSPSQTLQGSNAVIEFHQCTDFSEVAMIMIDFDQNNFGDLDTFEACAHEYRSRDDHGGRTAQGCMKILVNAINGASQVKKMDETMTDAISALAEMLYHDGEGFCECAKQSNADCPLCPNFMNFKTLLYESIDACISLDEIDCDAWTEFSTPCREEMKKNFVNVDFSNPQQCEFVHDGCGKAGPFPAFRRLDCDKEVSKESWDLYLSYSKACLDDKKGGGGSGSIPAPSPGANKTPPPSPKVVPSGGGGGVNPSPDRKPYVPPEKRDKNEKTDTDKSDIFPKEEPQDTPSPEKKEEAAPAVKDPEPKKKSHWFRNLIFLGLLGYGGYYLYQKRRTRLFYANYGANNDDGMYHGLAMESSTTFEPAFLPPPPSAVDGGSSYYGQQQYI